MTAVVFVLSPGVHVLDVAGPAHALTTATEHGAPHRLHYLAEQQWVPSHQGVPLGAQLSWPQLGRDDLVVVPGWGGAALPLSRATLDRIAAHHAAGGVVMSVCSGALALGAAGLLDGRRATTHHTLCDELGRRHPAATVVRDVLYVVDGRLITSAGVASGIDATLALLADRHGPALAARVARAMVVYLRRAGASPQLSPMLAHRDHTDDVVHRALDLLDTRFADDLPMADVARHAGVSTRTLTRHFTAVVGCTPLRYQQQLRREHAQLLIEQGATVEAAARTVGFADARMLRRLRTR